MRRSWADQARIEKVTVADVNRVAHQYLNLDQAVTAVMVPKGSGKPTRGGGGGFGGQENISLGEAKPTALPGWAQAAVRPHIVPAESRKIRIRLQFIDAPLVTVT